MILVAGCHGMVGSAVMRKLEERGHPSHLLPKITRQGFDLCNAQDVERLFQWHRPDYVVLAAAVVGGIYANHTKQVQFIRDNLQIQNNVIDACCRHGVRKLIFLGSSCAYPRECPQPIKEEYLLTGPLEETNQWYAVAKIAGIKYVHACLNEKLLNASCLMPTNLFGPNDNYNYNTSHVFPALIRRIHEAKEWKSPIVLWGDGTPKREFMHVDDMADAILYFMAMDENIPLVNVGWGKDISIWDLAKLMAKIIGFEEEILINPSLPNGTPRKLLDTSFLNSKGWEPSISLREGIASTYEDFVKNYDTLRK